MSSTIMNFTTFLECAKAMPANISILGRGDHGIGKSQLVFQLGEHFGLPVLDKRLSQMSEGDIIGLPKVEGGVTMFCPPEWYELACSRPCLLFFDELNRATPEVMQAAFQICLDRVHLSGRKLHPETRIFACVNSAQNYQINEMDPALLDRFWTVDLKPTPEEWLENFAKPRLHTYIYGFVKSNQRFLDPNPKAEASAVEPSRRSYERLNNALLLANVMDQPDAGLFYNLSRGFIGNEAAIAFTGYVKNLDKQITAADILDNFPKFKKKIGELGQEKWNICIDKIKEHVAKHSLTEAQGENLGKFSDILPDELIVVLWGSLSTPGMEKMTQVRIAHKALVKHILRIFKDNPDAMKKGAAK